MSETWTSLVSGVVGAIVGGAASLAGTMYVNKRQMATNARMRLYDELLPELETAVDSLINPQLPGDELAEERIPELLEKVRRVGAIAGRMEQRNSHNLWKLWREHQAELEVELKAWRERTKTPPMAVHADPDPLLGTSARPHPMSFGSRGYGTRYSSSRYFSQQSWADAAGLAHAAVAAH
jgi:hypothetical protein